MGSAQYIKETEEDFVTMMAYSPSKYLAEGTLRGIVKVTFFKCVCVGGVSASEADNLKKDGPTFRFRVGKRDNVQYTVSGWVAVQISKA